MSKKSSQPLTNVCLFCSGVAGVTGRPIEDECPGHQNAIAIAALAHPRVGRVSTEMALHISNRPVAEIAKRTGLTEREVKAVQRASAERHETLIRRETREAAGLPVERQPSS